MGRLPEKDIKLAGQMYLHGKTGDVTMKYGSGNWFGMKMGNIKGTNTWNAIEKSYGKKEGSKVRKNAAYALMRSVRVKK